MEQNNWLFHVYEHTGIHEWPFIIDSEQSERREECLVLR